MTNLFNVHFINTSLRYYRLISFKFSQTQHSEANEMLPKITHERFYKSIVKIHKMISPDPFQIIIVASGIHVFPTILGNATFGRALYSVHRF